jgi:putative hydrolase of the HAD superfamily
VVTIPAPVRWVLFDAVGTLMYADPPVTEVYRAAAQRFGSRLDDQQIGLRFRQALAAETGPADELSRAPTSEALELARWRRIVAAVFGDLPTADLDGLFESLWQHFAQPRHWRLYADVAPTLQRLGQAGWQLGIASNFDGRLLEIAAKMPELSVCERLFVSSQVGFSKPDPRFFSNIAEQLAVPPAHILLVGDDWIADCRGARAAGWQAIWLNRNVTAESTLPGITSLPQLLIRPSAEPIESPSAT